MATIHIESSKYHLNKDNVKVQSLPFNIAADCEANVDKYFNKYIKTCDDDSKYLIMTERKYVILLSFCFCSHSIAKKCSFRGYPLRGKL